MTGLLVILVLILAVFAWATITAARERVNRVGLARITVRWLLGRPWHGEPLTDAGFLRPGSKALTKTGHASRYHHRPHWQRAALRGGPTIAVVLALYGLVFYPAVTMLALQCAAAAAVAAGGWYGWHRWAVRKHRRSTLYPLHNALAQHLSVALPVKPESWLKVDKARTRAEIDLPASFDANPNHMAKILTAASARLGIEAPEPTWRLTGPRPKLILEAAPPPPEQVGFLDLRDSIEAAGRDQLVLGMGKRAQVVTVDLHADSPHLGLSIGSGGGKSVCACAICAQVLHRGGVAMILDYPKLVSLPMFRNLPNVAYADAAAAVHSALMWLGDELDRRAQVVRAGTDVDGNTRATFPRLLVVAEESNALMNRLRRYWADIREGGDPKRSPAIDALELALLMGRQLRVNVIQIGQYLTVRAAGSGEARENMGVRVLGRYSPNAWRTMAGEHPMPPKTKRPGLVQVVTDEVRQAQVVYFTPAEARRWAVSGEVTPCPHGMPCAPRVPVPAAPPQIGPRGGDDQGVVLETPPLVPIGVSDAVSLSEAIDLGLWAGSIASLRKAVQREPDAPQPVGRRGLANLFDPGELAEWKNTRRSP